MVVEPATAAAAATSPVYIYVYNSGGATTPDSPGFVGQINKPLFTAAAAADDSLRVNPHAFPDVALHPHSLCAGRPAGRTTGPPVVRVTRHKITFNNLLIADPCNDRYAYITSTLEFVIIRDFLLVASYHPPLKPLV